MKYYQGDTIRFDVGAAEGFNPDELDFRALIYKGSDDQVLVNKEDMERQESGAYRGTIPSEKTASMGPGRYIIEVLVRPADDLISIGKAEAFTLEGSQIKKHMQ